MKGNRKRDIRFSIIIGISLILSIIFVVKIVNELRVESEKLKEEKVINEIVQSNEKISKYLSDNIQFLQRVTDGIKKNDIILKEAELNNYLKIVEECNEFDFIGYINTDGLLRISEGESIDIRHKHYFISSNIEKDTSIGYDKLEPFILEDKIIYIIPIFDNEGNSLGSIFATSDPKKASKSF